MDNRLRHHGSLRVWERAVLVPLHMHGRVGDQQRAHVHLVPDVVVLDVALEPGADLRIKKPCITNLNSFYFEAEKPASRILVPEPSK